MLLFAKTVIVEVMHIIEKVVGGRKYRVLAESIWVKERKQPISRQVLLGPAETQSKVNVNQLTIVEKKRVGDVGALLWVAEKLGLVELIDEACGLKRDVKKASAGEFVLAVALQRACQPGAKKDLSEFLNSSVVRASCLPAEAYSGQAFHRVASQVTEEQLEAAQIKIAEAAIEKFQLSTDVLAFDSTNFDTNIATTNRVSNLAKRGHAKSKRSDLRVVGLGVLASEKEHIPLLHKTYPGNESDQSLLTSCMEGLKKLRERMTEQGEKTLVRDGGFWSEKLEKEIHEAGFGSIISMPLSHSMAEGALEYAAQKGRKKKLKVGQREVLAARQEVEMQEGKREFKRVLVVVHSDELLEGQRRGIAVALKKAKKELVRLAKRARRQRIGKALLVQRVEKALSRESLKQFVVFNISGTEAAPRLEWRVDAAKRRALEKNRLGKRVLCSDRVDWSTERIIHGFRGQWQVEEIFRRAKRGGLVPWGPSFQWADSSLRLHTFATVLGLTLVALARKALGCRSSAKKMMQTLEGISVSVAQIATAKPGRRPTQHICSWLSNAQIKAVKTFDLERWLPSISSTMTRKRESPMKSA